MENNIRQSILKTVLYADVFDCPLTSSQIWKYLISSKRFKRNKFNDILKNIDDPICSKNGFYFLTGREDLIGKTAKRKKESGVKFVLIYKIAAILSFVPSILLIGVSGGLSMDNADKNDDIDIFVITRQNSIWITRFLIIMILKILGKHRKRSDTKVADKICLNMLIDEGHLAFSRKKQNLYTAHEIVQMTPVFDRSKTYEKFIMKNLWIKKIMPNSVEFKKVHVKNSSGIKNPFINTLEVFAKIVQLWHIKKNKTVENISSGWLAFHPLDYNDKVMSSYQERLKKYGEKI